MFNEMIRSPPFQVGLAVDDIKGIQDAAVLKRLALQVSGCFNAVIQWNLVVKIHKVAVAELAC